MQLFSSLPLAIISIVSAVQAAKITGHPSEPYGGCTNNEQLKVVLPDNVKGKVNFIEVDKKLAIIKAVASRYGGRVLFDRDASNCFKEASLKGKNGQTVKAIVADICVGCYDVSKPVFQSLGGAPELTGSVEADISYSNPDTSMLQSIFRQVGGDSIFNQY
jgi:hypothetical protein